MEQIFYFKADMPVFEHVIEGCQCQGKACTRCGEKKCFEAFHTDKRALDDRTSACRICINLRRSLKRQANIEEHRKYHREYRRAHAEELSRRQREHYQQNSEERAKKSDYYQKHAEQIKALRKIYQEKHRQKIQEYRKGRYQIYAEYFREQKRVYYQENPDLIKERKRNYRRLRPELYITLDKAKFACRRARKAQTGGGFTVQQWLELKARYNPHVYVVGKKNQKFS